MDNNNEGVNYKFTPNRYNLTVSRIENEIKVVDWDRLKAYTYADGMFAPVNRWRSYECGCEGSESTIHFQTRDESTIHFPMRDGFIQGKVSFGKATRFREQEVKCRFWQENGRIGWKFEKFYEGAVDFQSTTERGLRDAEMRCQSNMLRFLNLMLDEGIITLWVD